MPTTPSTPAQNPVDMDAVAEWVGLHYQKNFAAESKEQRADWIARYVEMHAADSDAVGAAVPTKTVKFVVDVHNDDDDGPLYAVLEVDQAFLAKSARLVEACKMYSLNAAHVEGTPIWDCPDTVNSYQMGASRSGVIWFDAGLKTGGSCETEKVVLTELAAQFESSSDGDVVFLCDEHSAARGWYEENHPEDEEDDAEQPKSIHLLVDAITASQDTPIWASIKVDADFLRQLASLRTACIEFGLTEARVEGAPIWGSQDADDLRLVHCQLVVTRDGNFYHSSNPQELARDYAITTQRVGIAQALEAFHATADQKAVDLGEGAQSHRVPVEAPRG